MARAKTCASVQQALEIQSWKRKRRRKTGSLPEDHGDPLERLYELAKEAFCCVKKMLATGAVCDASLRELLDKEDCIQAWRTRFEAANIFGRYDSDIWNVIVKSSRDFLSQQSRDLGRTPGRQVESREIQKLERAFDQFTTRR